MRQTADCERETVAERPVQMPKPTASSGAEMCLPLYFWRPQIV